jgi:hypothetical protein
VKRIKLTADTWCGIFWFTFALLLCYAAGRLGIGSATEPGTGFIFFWSGLLMGFLSLALCGASVRERGDELPKAAKTNWPKIGSVLSALVFYAAFLERLGFVASAFLLMSFLFALSGAQGWARVVGSAGAVALGSFAIFELWLKIRLPKGVFGF